MAKNPDETDETTELNSWITQQLPPEWVAAAVQPEVTIHMNGFFFLIPG